MTTKSEGMFRVDGTAHESDDNNNDRVEDKCYL